MPSDNMEEMLPPRVNIFLTSLKILDEEKYTNIVLALVMVSFFIIHQMGQNVFNNIQISPAFPSILLKCPLLTEDNFRILSKRFHLLEILTFSLTSIFLVL